jgi:hypothetical protein
MWSGGEFGYVEQLVAQAYTVSEDMAKGKR